MSKASEQECATREQQVSKVGKRTATQTALAFSKSEPAFLRVLDGQRAAAGAYYEKHMTEVDRLMRGEAQAVEPIDRDVLKPELWRGPQWRWFFRVKE